MHIAQLKRIFSIPSEHVLLLGEGSSGRKSLTALAAFIGNFALFQIPSCQTYEMQDWHDRLRKLITTVGVDKTPTVFLLSEDQTTNKNMMEDINCLLSTDEVLSLYFKGGKRGREEFLPKLRENMQSKYKRVFGTDEEMLELLRGNTKERLHMAFCMNPMGENFRRHARAFPSLVKFAAANYFLPWPNEALRSVASQSLVGVEGLEMESEVISAFAEMQESARELTAKYKEDSCGCYYTTPANYLESLKVFKTLFLEKHKEILAGIQAYENGLEEFRRTEQLVTQMKAKLQDLEPELSRKSENAAQLADSLKKKQAEVTEETKIVEKDEEMAEEARKTAKDLQAEYQADLELALPELKEAERQIGGIKPDAIANLAAMGAPPEEVKLVAKALCIILDIKPKKVGNSGEHDYWMPKKIFTYKNIKWCSVEFDKENIPLAKITELRKINDNPSFAPEKLKSVSEPGEVLARWIRAIINFDQVNRVVAPKKVKVKEESERAKVAHEAWMSKSKQLEEKRALLSELNKEAKSAEEQKKRLMHDIDGTRKKIERARELLDLLKNEHKRWTDQRAILQEWHRNITGDILLSAAIIAYLGIFPPLYRELSIKSWSRILERLRIGKSDNYSLFAVLGNPLRKLSSSRVRFPADSASSDNVIIMERSTRWPLIIDPQLQVTDWVKSLPGMTVLKAGQGMDNVLKHLTVHISSGVPVLLEDIGEHIDSRLYSLLRKDIINKGKQSLIQFNGDVINISSEFGLYLSTRLGRPHYAPEVCSMLTMVNFAVTEEGLVEQALNLIVNKEDPNKEKSNPRNEIINKSLENKKNLKMREEELLKLVTTHREGILESDRLLETLKTTKAECQHSTMQVEEQKRLSERVEATRMKFKPVANYVAKLYFAVTDLSSIGSMYHYSLDWYMNLYIAALQSEPSGEKSDKLEFYKNTFIGLLYTNVCRSLFQRDRLVFSLSLCLRIAASEGKVAEEEVKCLCAGVEPVARRENAASEWLPEKAWQGVCKLSERLEAFKGLDKEIIEKASEWKALKEAPSFSNKLLEGYSPLQRLILLSVFRPDKFTELARELVESSLGKQYNEHHPVNLEEAFKSSSHKQPIVTILSPGVNPIESLKTLAMNRTPQHEVIVFSLGKGQGKEVRTAITRAAATHANVWVVLQNCHLATSCLGSLEKLLDDMHEEPRLNCRLWLTTLPSKEFPLSLLQKAVKVACDKPKGVAQSAMHSFKEIEGLFDEPGLQLETRKKLLFGLCLFHSVLAERTRFGTLAWNQPYNFSQADLLVTARQLVELLKDSEEVSWAAVDYLTVEANYGAQINDAMDSRVLRALAADFVGPQIMADNYQFCRLKDYELSKEMKVKEDYAKLIRSFPKNDNPELFGLGEAEFVQYSLDDAAEVRSMLSQLMSGSSKTAHQLQENLLAKVKDMIKELPGDLNKSECTKKYPIQHAECLNSVLQQEMCRYETLLNVVRSSLLNLHSALKGEVVLSKDLDEVAQSISRNIVPSLWHTHAYPSLKPLSSWTKDLEARTGFLEHWVKEGHPDKFKLSVFFRPQSFLAALKLNYARKHGMNFSDVFFEYEVGAEKKSKGKLIEGLYMEGARWDRESRCLAELGNDTAPEEIPAILFIPTAAKTKPAVLCFHIIGLRVSGVQAFNAQ